LDITLPEPIKIVDPSSPIPKYLQICSWLKGMISSGRYREGDQLPSEMELARICQVNRNTLRQALSELAAQGLLLKEKGRGTFISGQEPETLKHQLKRISSFKDDLNGLGLSEDTKILEKGIKTAPANVVNSLLLGKDRKKVVEVVRLRTVAGTPLILEKSYLPEPGFKGILKMDLSGSMYKLLAENFHVVLARCQRTIRAVNFDQNISKIFGVPKNTAGFFVEAITFNEQNVPIEVLYSHYRGDKYVFEIEQDPYSF
jgi:GntR family transcriptional regulator